MRRDTRRQFARSVIGAAAVHKAWARNAIDREIEIFADQRIGLIRPELHGQFGLPAALWVGSGSRIPNVSGFHEMAVEYLVALGVPVLQWPGRCSAANYNWRESMNSRFGTREYLSLCQLVGAQPYLSGGMPAELPGWVEYCKGLQALPVRYWASNNRLPSLPFVISCKIAADEPWPDGYAIRLPQVTEDAILHQRRLLDAVDSKRKVGLVIEDETASTAVAAGLRLNAIHRQADKLVMCNSALESLLRFQHQACVRTQAYYAFLLARPHRGKMSVKAAPPQANPRELSVSSSSRDNSLVVTIVNPRTDAPVRLRCVARGREFAMAKARTLSEYSSGVPQNLEVRVRPEGMLAELPAMSVTTITAELTSV